MKPDYETLADDFKRMREVRGKSLRKVSQECGVSAATLNRIEHARHRADFETVCAVVDWIGNELRHYVKQD